MTPAQAAAHNLVALRENITDDLDGLVKAVDLAARTGDSFDVEYAKNMRTNVNTQVDALFQAVNAPCLKCAEGEE